jgi:uncharacterized surface protein with fasciclin (FAS1) repeats
MRFDRGYAHVPLGPTVQGGALTASMKGGKLELTDAKGGTAAVTIANVYQSNGVIHVIDAVLLPN